MKMTVLLGVLLSVASTVAGAAELQNRMPSPSAQTGMSQMTLDSSVAQLRSSAEVYRHLASRDTTSPLRLLSKPALARFVDSLVFSERGLASFRTDDLAAELTVSQAYQVLALFGQQTSILSVADAKIRTNADIIILDEANWCHNCHGEEFLEGYYCEGPGTCRKSSRHACTGNC